MITLDNPEVEWEKKYGRILYRFGGRDNPIEIGFSMPNLFKKMHKRISMGDIYYREFYTDPRLGIVSSHCKMSDGAYLKSHLHPNADEYIYVVQGALVNHLRGEGGDIIVPPEHQESIQELMEDRSVHSWYKIPKGELHMIQAIEPNTHFIQKFVLQ